MGEFQPWQKRFAPPTWHSDLAQCLKTRDTGAVSHRANEATPPAVVSATHPESLIARAKGLLEFSAAAGVLLFASLSVMYDQFYGPLGLEPGDVGLTQTVIVQRALAGVLLVAGTGLLTLAVFLLVRSIY